MNVQWTHEIKLTSWHDIISWKVREIKKKKEHEEERRLKNKKLSWEMKEERSVYQCVSVSVCVCVSECVCVCEREREREGEGEGGIK